MCGVYVFSPLVWAICGSGINDNNNVIKNIGCDGYKWGISRIGSGSHTMALYSSAMRNKQDNNNVSFVIANNFTQLRDGKY